MPKPGCLLTLELDFFSEQNQNSRLIVLSLPLKIDLFHTFYSPRNSCRLEYYSPILK